MGETENVDEQTLVAKPTLTKLFRLNIGSQTEQNILLRKNDRAVDPTIETALNNYTQPEQWIPSETAYVHRAREGLREFFANHEDVVGTLRDAGAIIVLGGSLIYGDPKNGDADIVVIGGKQPLDKTLARSVYKLRHDLVSHWEQGGFGKHKGAEPHISIITEDALSPERLSNLITIDQDSITLLSDVADASMIFTGVPLFPDQDSERFGELQQSYRDIANSNSFLCPIINANLAECLQIRTERREG